MRLGDLISADVEQAMNTIMNKEVGVGTAFDLAALAKARKKQKEHFETVRKSLFDRFCEKDENGQLKMTEDKRQYVLADAEGFDKGFRELMDLDVIMPKIKKDDLMGIKEIAPQHLFALQDLIE